MCFLSLDANVDRLLFRHAILVASISLPGFVGTSAHNVLWYMSNNKQHYILAKPNLVLAGNLRLPSCQELRASRPIPGVKFNVPTKPVKESHASNFSICV